MTVLRKGGLPLLVGIGLILFTTQAANGQYSQDFEAPGINASASGVVLTGQDGYYLPVAGSEDFLAFTYAGNALGIVSNPEGGDQFIGARAPGLGNFPRAQRDMTWGTGQWLVTYDTAVTYVGTLDPPDYAGSFSSNPYGAPVTHATYIHLFNWWDPIVPYWAAWYHAYLANGATTTLPGVSPGPEWDYLDVNHWYRFTTLIDFDINQIIEASITDLSTGTTTTAALTDVYLGGGAAGGLPLPTALRFFTGGGTGTDPDNVTAWDNISIEKVGGGLCGDANCDTVFNGADIDPFFLALGDPNLWIQTYPNCDILESCDINYDGAVNGADIDPFFVALGLGYCP